MRKIASRAIIAGGRQTLLFIGKASRPWARPQDRFSDGSVHESELRRIITWLIAPGMRDSILLRIPPDHLGKER